MRRPTSHTTTGHANIYSIYGGQQPVDTHQLGGNPDYEHIDLDTLDVYQTQPQDTQLANGSTELNNGSMDGPYSTVSGPTVPQRNPAVKTTTEDAEKRGKEKANGIVMVENYDYEGIGEASGICNPGTSDEVVMVENADYEGIGTEQRGCR